MKSIKSSFLISSMNFLVGVFANQHKLLLAAVHTEVDVIDTFFVVLRCAIDHGMHGMDVSRAQARRHRRGSPV
jgi:hypothetical protein